MENQLQQMGRRMRELRTVLEIPVSEMAALTGVTEKEYLDHESGAIDSSFTFIYRCAKRFGVDISALVRGETPKLSYYNLTRAGEGTRIRRRAGFEYQHLAAMLKNRQVEPFVVKAPVQPETDEIHMSTHTGQEFNYILKGCLKVKIGDKIELMHPGDSILYDSSRPHGMIAIGDEPCEFLAFVVRGEGDVPEPVPEAPAEEEMHDARSGLMYRKFMSDYTDENGLVKDVRFHYPDNFNFAWDVLDALAEKCPDKTAMVWLSKHHEERRFSFREIALESKRTANYLLSLGIRKGDRVMLIMKRRFQFWFVINALHRIGAVAVPASNQMHTKDLIYRFREGGITAAIYTSDDNMPSYMAEAQKEIPAMSIRIVVGEAGAGEHDFDREYAAFSTEMQRPSGMKATDPAIMFFSSGTTGYPKMVLHSATYPLGHIMTGRWWHNVDPEGLHFTISDTGWGKSLWGKIYGQWLSECAVFVYDFDRFDAADILTLFRKYNITTFCAPPTMYRFFIREDLSKYDLSSIKYACTAGEALNPEVFHIFEKATGLKIMEGFGQTETTLTVANLVGMTPKPGSMGKPSPQYPIELVNTEDKPVPIGEVGEIAIRAERNTICGLFSEYYRNPEQTAESWRNGLYHTGDTAWMDEDGYFWYVGRIDDLIKSSGYRIGPFEIESVLMELPYVLECAVVGVPDPVRGQLVKAFIVLTKDKEGSPELKKEIQDYVKKSTAPYKYPRKIEFMKELPKTPSGKIRRTELRKMTD